MQEEKNIKQDAFKVIEHSQIQMAVETVEESGGTENAVVVVAVSSLGEIKVVTIINIMEAKDYYVDECSDYMESDFQEGPGIYLVEFKVNGSGPDYNGEYDSWAEFDNIIKYKIDIADKRKDKFKEDSYHMTFGTKVYDNPGSEYPRCLFVIDDSGNGFILDVLNEAEAYKSVLTEMVWQLEELDRFFPEVAPMHMYEANVAIVGDMVNILDRDDDEDIKLSKVKKIKLVLEDKPLERLSRKEIQEQEWEAWRKYVDELREQDEHIK